jgi:hypothetical protein
MKVKSKTYYICHYCVDYITVNLKDIKKHVNRKNKCKCSTLLSFDEASLLSINKKFIFLFDNCELIRDDYIFIVKNYTNNKNIIKKDFKNIENYQNNIEEKNEEDNNNNDEEKYIQLNELISNDLTNNDLTNNDLTNNDLCNNDIDTDSESEYEIDDKNFKQDEFDKIYYNNDKKKYVCDNCFSEYISKQNMKKHLLNNKKCELRKSIYNVMEISKKRSELQRIKQQEEDEKFKIHLQNGNKYIQNINNTQNINNVQNINNNTRNNTYHVSLTDFVNERYDLTHIKDSFYEKKDFFIYPNFLRMIMENKKNQNIFFSNNEAIIYTDNELNKMNSDKAGYLVLDKLSQSFEQLLNQQDEEVREYYSFVSKYYYVLKGHYKHDTIFKDYDVDKRQFKYTAQGNLFRSRDKYLSKIVGTVNHFNDDVRQHMNIKGDDIKNIPLINPNIEDYASIKMRYRDLRDRD